MARLEVGVDITVEGARELGKVGDALGDTSDDLDKLAVKLDDAADAARRAADDIDTAAGSINFDKASAGAQRFEDTGEGVRNTVNGITDVFGAATDETKSFGERLALGAGGIADVASGMRNAVIPAFQAVVNGGLTSAAAMVTSVAQQVAGWVTLGVQSLLNAAKVAAAWLIALGPVGVIVAAVVAAVALIILNWDKIMAFIEPAIQAFKDVLSGFATFFGELWAGVITVFEGVADTIGDIWTTITDAASAAWDGLAGIIKGAINAVISVINSFIGFINGIQIHIPSVGVGPVQTPAFDWNGLNLATIPHLASGGIIDSPTLALLGERHKREAVIPLDQLGGGGLTINLNVSGDLRASERTLPTLLQRAAVTAGLT